ncbi:hypothetical protein PRZ48_008830 [Zasmidium cellare]|uniref:Uncharacterized protein n=1 Tax=Zasmidium cellare TaxID=395010 RepID=A0ABR0EGK6_ZASCE|nr:hypothetical protein PRZ48_008830 [Zasmidium cellare]
MDHVAAVLISPKAKPDQPDRRWQGLQGFTRIDITLDKYYNDNKWLVSPNSRYIGLPLMFTTRLPSNIKTTGKDRYILSTGANETARIFFSAIDPESKKYREVFEPAIVRGDFVVAREDGKPLEPMQLYQIVHFIDTAIFEVSRHKNMENRGGISPLSETLAPENMKEAFHMMRSIALKEGDLEVAMMKNPFSEEDEDTQNEADSGEDASSVDTETCSMAESYTTAPEEVAKGKPAKMVCDTCWFKIDKRDDIRFECPVCKMCYKGQWVEEDNARLVQEIKELQFGEVAEEAQ